MAVLRPASSRKFVHSARTTRTPLIAGIGGTHSSKAHGTVELSIHHSTQDNTVWKINAYVIKCITRLSPSKEVDTTSWECINKTVPLADPQFYKPQEVDILIGADLFYDLLRLEQLVDDG